MCFSNNVISHERDANTMPCDVSMRHLWHLLSGVVGARLGSNLENVRSFPSIEIPSMIGHTFFQRLHGNRRSDRAVGGPNPRNVTPDLRHWDLILAIGSIGKLRSAKRVLDCNSSKIGQ